MRTLLLLIILGAFAREAFAQSGYYRVKFPDDFTVYGCHAMADTVYPVIEQYPGCPFAVSVSVKDQVFKLNQTGGCKKILRTWTLIYLCDYDPNKDPVFIINPTDSDIGPTVFGIPANRGHLQYTQVIKVVDQEGPVFLDCPSDPVTFCDYTSNDPAQYNNGHVDRCEGPAHLSIKVTDACSKSDMNIRYQLFLDLDGNGTQETFISSSSPGAWPIHQTIIGDTVCVNIEFPAGFGFPYGTHRIQWIANDNCGNERLCNYDFIIKDCKAPTLICRYGMSVNIMQTGMITVSDQIFIQRVEDNCSSASQIQTAIRKAGQGTGFPAGEKTVAFDCSELGQQFVEVWGRDASGNADFCLTFIDVQDNMGSCPPSSKFVAKITTPDDDPIAGVQVTLMQANKAIATYTTGEDGLYEVGSLAAGCHYQLLPALSAQPKEGINTADLLLLSAHLGGILPLSSPYYLLAADVNKSGSLTAADAEELVKMILGTQDHFPAYTSAWHFSPAHFTFSNPANPWSASLPAIASPFCISGLMPAPKADFIGYKIGDLNASGAAQWGKLAVSDRGGQRLQFFETKDQTFSAGQEVRVSIQTPDLAQLAGFQFTLDYNAEVLRLQSIVPDLLEEDCIATPEIGRVTACWYSPIMLDPSIMGKNMKARALVLVFQALRSGVLSQSLRMTSAITEAQAYGRDLSPVDIGLSLEPIPVGPKSLGPNAGSLELSVRPSIVLDRVQATYYLPQEGDVLLTLTDASGNVLHLSRLRQGEGYHQAFIDLGADVRPGLLFLRVESAGGVEVQRITKM